MLRNTVSLGIAFIVMLLISPKGIEILHRLKFGQEVRDDGPEAHLKKQGTPTMGGILDVYKRQPLSLRYSSKKDLSYLSPFPAFSPAIFNIAPLPFFKFSISLRSRISICLLYTSRCV